MNGAPSIQSHPDAATLGAYHDGELRGFTRAEVEAHLGACPRCRREMSELDAVAAALRSLPTVEPPQEVHEAVLARLAHAPHVALRPRHRTWRTRWKIAAAIAALAALIGGYDIFSMSQAGLQPAALSVRQGSRAPTAAKALAPAAHAPSAQNGTLSVPYGSAQAQAHAPARSSRLFSDGAASTAQARPGQATSPGATSSGSSFAPGARLIARTAEVDMQVPNVQRAFDAVTAIAARVGGYVADSNNDASAATAGAYAATLTLRVPAANFQVTLDRLAALPHRKLSERSGSQDITDSVHDLQASLQALQATRSQLMSLMRQARNVRDAMVVLDRLTAVNTNIDAVQSQIMASANSVMLSSITVNLAPEPRKQTVVVPARRHPGGGWQPGHDLSSAIANVRQALQAIVTFAIYAAVYLALPVLLAALALLARRLRRRALGHA